MFLLERFSTRTVANAAVATLAAVLVLVVIDRRRPPRDRPRGRTELDLHDLQPAVPARRRRAGHADAANPEFHAGLPDLRGDGDLHAAGRCAGPRDLPASREPLDQGRARRVAGVLFAAIPALGHGDGQSRRAAGRRDPLGAPVRRDRLVRQHRACWPRCRPGRSSASSASQARRRSASSTGSTRSR